MRVMIYVPLSRHKAPRRAGGRAARERLACRRRATASSWVPRVALASAEVSQTRIARMSWMTSMTSPLTSIGGSTGGRGDLGEARLAAVPEDHGHQVLVLQGPDGPAHGGVFRPYRRAISEGPRPRPRRRFRSLGDASAARRRRGRYRSGMHTCKPSCRHGSRQRISSRGRARPWPRCAHRSGGRAACAVRPGHVGIQALTEHTSRTAARRPPIVARGCGGPLGLAPTVTLANSRIRCRSRVQGCPLSRWVSG